ncbi:hypothetical protein BGP_6168 [Beggiatoa sp. PS]|nr:hypothetical protein BGP_6168 [Beggiatoa sp. PS]
MQFSDCHGVIVQKTVKIIVIISSLNFYNHSFINRFSKNIIGKINVSHFRLKTFFSFNFAHFDIDADHVFDKLGKYNFVSEGFFKNHFVI